MKIMYMPTYKSTTKEVSVGDAICGSCDDYDANGQIETLEASITKMATIIGVLAQALYDAKLLSDEAVRQLISANYRSEG